METSKRYYWLKLHDNFFDREEIKVVENMPNGKDYIIFYLKLLLKSVRTEGQLKFRDVIPYTPEMLSSITGTNIDTVRVAIDLFVKLDLMDIWDDGTLFMVETQSMIGSETDSAKRKRKQREKEKELKNGQTHKQLSEGCDNVTPTSQKSHLDKEEDKEIDKDNYLLYLEEIIDFYCSKAGILSVNFKPKEFDSVKELLIKKIPVDVIKKGIDSAFKDYKPSYAGEKISSFNYCKPVVLKLWNNINAKKKGVKKGGSNKRSVEDELREQGIGL